jgi:uncharacterized membrane protein
VTSYVLATYNNTGYKVMLLLHVLAVIIAFAPAWLTPIVLRASGADRAGSDAMGMSILRLSLPFVAIAGIFGFGLAGMSKPEGSDELLFKMSQGWLIAAIILWVVQLLVLWFLARPAFKALAEGAAEARGRVMAATGITHVILLVMLWLMIFKPGGPSVF